MNLCNKIHCIKGKYNKARVTATACWSQIITDLLLGLKMYFVVFLCFGTLYVYASIRPNYTSCDPKIVSSKTKTLHRYTQCWKIYTHSNTQKTRERERETKNVAHSHIDTKYSNTLRVASSLPIEDGIYAPIEPQKYMHMILLYY